MAFSLLHICAMSGDAESLAYYSYVSPNLNGELWDCLNQTFSCDRDHFRSDVISECDLPIYLHTKSNGRRYLMHELLYLNGSETPFTFHTLPEDLEFIQYECKNEEGCSRRIKLSNSDEVTPAVGSINTEAQSTIREEVGNVTKEEVPDRQDVIELPPDSDFQLQEKPTQLSEEDLSHATTGLERKTSGIERTKPEQFVLPVEVFESIAVPAIIEKEITKREGYTFSMTRFPFFRGSNPKNGPHSEIMTLAEVEAELAVWRLLLPKLSPALCQFVELRINVIQTNAIGLTCSLCKRSNMLSAAMIFQHSTAPRHIKAVYAAGLVFCRTRDLGMTLEIFREAARRTNCPIPIRPAVRLKSDVYWFPTAATAPLPSASSMCFPFLDGYEKGKCHDAVTLEEVENVLVVWRPLVQRLTSPISKIMKNISPDYYPYCSICGCQPMQPGSVFQHSLSNHHISGLCRKGLVLSRSNDLNVFLAILREAARMVANPRHAIESTVSGKVSDIEPNQSSEVDVGDCSKNEPTSSFLSRCNQEVGDGIAATSSSSPAPFFAELDESSFPFLNGFSEEECDDVIEGDVMELLHTVWYPAVEAQVSIICQLCTIPDLYGNVSRICLHCDESFDSDGECLKHTLTRAHLEKAVSNGVVFSNSKDFLAANQLLSDAKSLNELIEASRFDDDSG